METINSLEANSANYLYKNRHGITQKDVDAVNHSIAILESGRTKDMPIMGDIIQCSTPGDGKIKYMGGHLDTDLIIPEPNDWRGGHICVKPSHPFVFHDYVELTSFSTSGGYWFKQREKEMFEFIDKDVPKMFCQWGHNGACHHGAIYYNAKVNVWKLLMEEIY